jgi:hypothetical protein
MADKHSHKTQKIDSNCHKTQNHCWKYMGYYFDKIYTQYNKNYIELTVLTLISRKLESKIDDDWKEQMMIGEQSLLKCIVCRCEKIEFSNVISFDKINKNRINIEIQKKYRSFFSLKKEFLKIKNYDLDKAIKLINNPNSLKLINGVGEATFNLIINAGFSILTIIFTPPSIFKQETGIGEKLTYKILSSIMKLLDLNLNLFH